MVKDVVAIGSARDAERALVLSYAPVRSRTAFAALLTLDETLGRIVRTTREPMVGRMRLTWWYEALVALDIAAPPAEPLLVALHEHVLPHGVSGATLATMTEAWEILLDPEIDRAALDRFAAERGGVLFDAAARVFGVKDARIAVAGAGWPLADSSRSVSDPTGGEAATGIARASLDRALTGRWPRLVRALGALALLARYDVMTPSPAPGSPRRLARILAHRLIGF